MSKFSELFRTRQSQDLKPPQNLEHAIFAAGCFWGVEDEFRRVKGVFATAVGYTGGHKANPTYKEVCGGHTGHAEAVEIAFDPGVVKYEELVKLFFELHDPTTPNRQGPDVGEQYRSAIFYVSEAQKVSSEHFIDKLKSSGILRNPIVTQVCRAEEFYLAENYHQQYVEKGGHAICHVRLHQT